MSRATLALLALRAYPAAIRSAADAEVLGTLLDAGDESVGAFVRELASVLCGGMVARIRRGFAQPAWRLGLDALGYGALAWSVWLPARVWLHSFGLPPGILARLDRYDVWMVGLLGALFLYALGLRGIAGLVGIAAVVEHKLSMTFTWGSYILAVPVLLGFIAMAVGPARPHPPLRALPLRMATAAAAIALTYWIGAWPLGIYLYAGVAVAALPLNPALALGLATMFLSFGGIDARYGEWTPQTVWMLAAVPLALTLFTLGGRILRQPD